jgi:hypothetical protein
MDAELAFKERHRIGDGIVVELVAWQLPRKLAGSEHSFKYRLALIVRGVNVLRYDNEAGKGDHRHIGQREFAYHFVDLDQLKIDFWRDVEEWQKQQSGS